MSAPKFSFCERVTATPTSPEHIRRVGPEGLKHGGGAPDTTLCGSPLRNGWDLEMPVTDETVHRLDGGVHESGSPFLCRECSAQYWGRT